MDDQLKTLKSIGYAVDLCKELHKDGGWLSTNVLLAGINVEHTGRSQILTILHALVKAGVLESSMNGKKYYWRLKDHNYNRVDPLNGGKIDRKHYDKKDDGGKMAKLSKFYNKCCARCFSPIDVGAPIVKWSVPGGKETWVHADCNHTEKKSDDSDTGSKRNIDDSALVELAAEVGRLQKEVALLSKLRKVTIEVKHNDKSVTIEDRTHPIFEQVLFHIGCGDHVMLVGPKGCGKTYLAEQVAEALERDYGMLSLSGGVTEGKLFGRVAPNINTGENVYTATRFVELYETGGLYLLDEVDAADPNVLLSINGALANGNLPLDRPKKPIAKKHKHFVCMAAANTWGNGADRQYVGRNQQDSAFTERFVQIAMDYDEALEIALCPGADDLVATLHGYRAKIMANKLERTLSTRFILRAYNWLQHGKTQAYVDEMLFAGWRSDEVRKVKGYC